MANYDFFITRIGDDPTAPLEFYPPKGSDELHDALKRAYPHLSSLQARMREAVIEFYLREQGSYSELLHYTPDTTMSVSPSNLSSNELSFVSTSYTPPTMESTPNSSDATSSSTPSQKDLMNVWTLSTSTQAKIHKRRNMTAEEKIKYKAKRLAGACNDCRRRRRKVRTEIGFLYSVTLLAFPLSVIFQHTSLSITYTLHHAVFKDTHHTFWKVLVLFESQQSLATFFLCRPVSNKLFHYR